MTDFEMRELERAAAKDVPGAAERLTAARARTVEVEIEGRLNGVEAIERFVLAGNATVTLENLETKARMTYRFRRPRAKIKDQPEHARPIYVDVMTGSDNEASYSPLGVVRTSETERPTYGPSRVTTIAATDPKAKGAAWLMGHVIERKELPSVMVAHHEGRCGKCGRKLTVPESIESGIGPECAAGKARKARAKREAAAHQARTVEVVSESARGF